MDTKSKHQVKQGQPASLLNGFVILAVLLVVAVAAMSYLFPRHITPADASADQFSGERAMQHLEVIAREPHPQSSPAQFAIRDYLVAQLTNMGLEVEVQRTSGLENVVARLHGSDPSGAVVILAHYDTVFNSPGAGDNSSAVAALVEVIRTLSAGPQPRNDIIALFDDGEELPDALSGTKAFVREHRWMSDIRLALSMDTATVGFIVINEAGPENNGFLVHALAEAYNGGAWNSFSGGGGYDSTPFREAGLPVFALEDNYPFKEKHTPGDVIGIINPAVLQQMGDQVVSIARVLGSLDLANPWGEQETFFTVPFIGFIHYPVAWSLPLAVTAGILLALAIGLTLRRKLTSWRGLGIGFGLILAGVILSVLVVTLLMPTMPKIFNWETSSWPEWPEVIPPNGWVPVIAFGLLVLGFGVGFYSLARRWSSRVDISLVGLLPFFIAGLLLSIAEPRTAFAFIWPGLIGSLSWAATAVLPEKHRKWSLDAAAFLAALPVVAIPLLLLPGTVMSDGMKSLNILAGIEALLLGVVLPALDGLLVRRIARQ